MLDNFSTGNRANLDGLDVEIVEGELRSYERVHNAVRGDRGRLPPRRARLGAPLGAGSADLERGQRRGHAERAARRARRGRPPRRLLVVGVRLRLEPADADDGGRRRPTRSRRTASRSSPPSATASASRASTSRSRRSCSATSTSSARGRARSRSTPPPCRSSSRRSPPASRSTIYGDGEQSRDFTYVGNVVDATIRAGDAEGASGEIFNVAAGAPASVNQRRRHDRRDPRQAGRAPRAARRAPATSATPGPTSRSRERVLGYAPEIALEDGLRRTVESLLG